MLAVLSREGSQVVLHDAMLRTCIDVETVFLDRLSNAMTLSL